MSEQKLAVLDQLIEAHNSTVETVEWLRDIVYRIADLIDPQKFQSYYELVDTLFEAVNSLAGQQKNSTPSFDAVFDAKMAKIAAEFEKRVIPLIDERIDVYMKKVSTHQPLEMWVDDQGNPQDPSDRNRTVISESRQPNFLPIEHEHRNRNPQPATTSGRNRNRKTVTITEEQKIIIKQNYRKHANADIAEWCGQSLSWVEKAIRQLKQQGYIR